MQAEVRFLQFSFKYHIYTPTKRKVKLLFTLLCHGVFAFSVC